jgi:hypothetical protein
VIQRIQDLVYRYYPRNVEYEEPAFAQSEQWRAHTSLRERVEFHSQSRSEVGSLLAQSLPPESIRDDSDPGAYPSYNFRILLTPGEAWPPEGEWNWDYNLALRHGQVVWADLFLCYLGQFHTVVCTELDCAGNAVRYRRRPGEDLLSESTSMGGLKDHLSDLPGQYVDLITLKAIIPDVACEVCGLGEATVFSLLFGDTYQDPAEWDGIWRLLDPSPIEPPIPLKELSSHLDQATIGNLIPEATIRNTLGTLPADFSSSPISSKRTSQRKRRGNHSRSQ